MSKHIVITEQDTLQYLCNMAVEQGYTHVWVHPSAGMEYLESNGTAFLSEEWDNPISNYQFKEDAPNNHLVSVYARKSLAGNRKSHAVLVTFLAYSPWHWQALSADKVLELVHLLEEKLGIPIGSPSTTGMKYVQQVVSKYHPKRIARPAADLSKFNFTAPLVWQRDPTPEELSRKYAYCVDRNSSYPRVGVAEKFGVGEPTYYPEGREFDKRLPGMWRIGPFSAPELDERLPHPFYKLAGREWLPTAIVKLLTDKECIVDVKEAIVFEKAEFVFKDSIEALWELRCSYEKGTPERDAFKNIMNSLVGTTRAAFDSWKNRPDWYTQFVACARAVVYYNMYKVAEKDDMYPILCLTDSLVYLSDEETPELAMPHLLLSPNSLGGYKCEYRMELTDEVRKVLTSKLSPGMKTHALKELRGE